MKKDFLRVKIDVDDSLVEGYLDVDKITYFRRHRTDPNWTIVFTEHRFINIYISFAEFCKALEELHHES